MKRTRNVNQRKSNTKGLCIYIWQEKADGGTDTYIDHVGDESLLEVYNKRIVADALLEQVQKLNQ